MKKLIVTIITNSPHMGDTLDFDFQVPDSATLEWNGDKVLVIHDGETILIVHEDVLFVRLV